MIRLASGLRGLLAVTLLTTVWACSEQVDPVGVEWPQQEQIELPTAAAPLDATPVEYTLSWDGGAVSFPVIPVRRAASSIDYYSIGRPIANSSNTADGLEEKDTGQFFLYQNSLTGQVSLIVILDAPNDGGGIFRFNLTMNGVPGAGAYWSIKDDSGEISPVQNGSTSAWWRGGDCCTDGGVLEGEFDQPFVLTFNVTRVQNLTTFKWRSLDEEADTVTSIEIPESMLSTLVLTAEEAADNTAPNAVAGGPGLVELDGAPQADVVLDGTGSSDPDEDELSYRWLQDGEEVATGATPTLSLGLGTHTFTLEVSDGSLSATDDVVVEVVDPSPPVVESSVSGTEGANGWYVSAVDVSWTVTDLESEVVADCPDVSVAEGVEELSCTATSAGGETSASVQLQVDPAPPVIAFLGTHDEYAPSAVVEITCDVSDELSGVESVECDGASGEAWTFGIGATSLQASATDVAGNQAEESTSFEVTADADSVEDLVRGWIANRGIANALAQKLRAAERASDRGNGKAAQGSIDAFENQVRALTGRWLTEAQAEFLLSLF